MRKLRRLIRGPSGTLIGVAVGIILPVMLPNLFWAVFGMIPSLPEGLKKRLTDEWLLQANFRDVIYWNE